jgi:hypothetical protein
VPVHRGGRVGEIDAPDEPSSAPLNAVQPGVSSPPMIPPELSDVSIEGCARSVGEKPAKGREADIRTDAGKDVGQKLA